MIGYFEVEVDIENSQLSGAEALFSYLDIHFEPVSRLTQKY